MGKEPEKNKLNNFGDQEKLTHPGFLANTRPEKISFIQDWGDNFPEIM